MAHKKPTMPADPDKSPEEQALEDRIDALMDPHQEDADPADAPAPAEDTPSIDIFAGQKTAPELKVKPAKEEKSAEVDDKQPIEKGAADTTAETADEAPEAKQEIIKTEAAADTEDTLPDDSETDKAVDDITRSESDALLEAEDNKAKFVAVPNPKRGRRKLGIFAHAWVRRVFVLLLLLLIAGAAAWPTSRYYILNTAGVRSSASLKVVDSSTGLPLRDVSVRLGELAATSDQEGMVAFPEIKLGEQELRVERVAFKTEAKTLVIGWGSNPLGELRLEATGAQYVFNVTDFLSGKPITKAEASSDQAYAIADKDGKVTLTMEDPGKEEVTVTVKAEQYRSEELTFDVTRDEPFDVKMVPANPVVFITEEDDGTFAVNRVDVDGKNRKRLLGDIDMVSHPESEFMLDVSPDGQYAALVSQREDRRNKAGDLLDTLTLINVQSGKAVSVDYGEQLRLLGWHNTRIVYAATYADASAETEGRQRIISFDSKESARAAIAKAQDFKGLLFARGQVYYSVDSSADGTPRVVRINADGSGERTLLEDKVWTIMRTSAHELTFDSPNKGARLYDMESGKLSGTDKLVARNYEDGPRGNSVWIDKQEDEGMVVLYDAKVKKDTMLTSVSATVRPPLRWLNDTSVLYAVESSEESALYAISTAGGEAVKITSARLVTVLTYGY